MSAVTLLVPYSSAGQENGGVKIEVPGQSVDPGESFRIYLWGKNEAALDGYTLTQGSDGLGAGTVRQYPGQTDAELFGLDGTGGLKDFNWPVLSLLSVVAIGQCFVVDGNDVSLFALPGEDVTRLFRLSGNALAPAVGAPKLCGTVRATAARSPWCREWPWITPATPASGLPAGTCDSGDKDRDAADYWFFLLRYGVLVHESSLSLALSLTASDTYEIDENDIEEDQDYDYGQVWAQLSWNTLDDLDLWVVDPCGNRIWYEQNEATCDGKIGTLDIDANAGLANNMSSTPVERIAWEDPPRGTYTVLVSFWASHIPGDTVAFNLLIQTGKGVVALSDSITINKGHNADYKTMLTFTY